MILLKQAFQEKRKTTWNLTRELFVLETICEISLFFYYFRNFPLLALDSSILLLTQHSDILNCDTFELCM